ncbi:hypothetical protein H257_09983 [Aphanomyces astaci]|uniref:Uncharacterized protein n=1 Tax=Aphanomyces astaci TaxID=112090 RepID=W4G9F1_APHAT|nr:hypothetical protein H257_09983 [Aphanomyces astaci]ETV75553.1 hypothetical protein H257_09983 [Aphanomyces astaci]|eukprot:XP_009834684.1 hypothetical protein H257_09983 [Aphanomyces astaci]
MLTGRVITVAVASSDSSSLFEKNSIGSTAIGLRRTSTERRLDHLLMISTWTTTSTSDTTFPPQTDIDRASDPSISIPPQMRHGHEPETTVF